MMVSFPDDEDVRQMSPQLHQLVDEWITDEGRAAIKALHTREENLNILEKRLKVREIKADLKRRGGLESGPRLQLLARLLRVYHDSPPLPGEALRGKTRTLVEYANTPFDPHDPSRLQPQPYYPDDNRGRALPRR